MVLSRPIAGSFCGGGVDVMSYMRVLAVRNSFAVFYSLSLLFRKNLTESLADCSLFLIFVA